MQKACYSNTIPIQRITWRTANHLVVPLSLIVCASQSRAELGTSNRTLHTIHTPHSLLRPHHPTQQCDTPCPTLCTCCAADVTHAIASSRPRSYQYWYCGPRVSASGSAIRARAGSCVIKKRVYPVCLICTLIPNYASRYILLILYYISDC